MSRKLRLLRVLLAFSLPAATMAAWLPAFHESSHPGFAHDALPNQVGSWTAVADDVFSEDVVNRLGTDAYLLRRFESEGRLPIWLYVGFYSGIAAAGGKYHDPEDCYPGKGWEIVGYASVEAPLDGGETLQAKLITVQQGSVAQEVLYWFQPAQRWPAPRAAEELLRVFDAFRGTPQYAFVRLSGSVQVGADARANLEEFASAIAPSVRLVVDGLDQEQRGGI